MQSENALLLEVCSDSLISKRLGNHCLSDGGKRFSFLSIAVEELKRGGKAFADERGKRRMRLIHGLCVVRRVLG